MPEYTYEITQSVWYRDPVEFDSPAAVASWIELGEWDRKHNEVKDQRVKVIDAEGKVVYDSASDAGNDRPRSSCGCGYGLVWVSGHWEHDAAEAFWGGDHSTDGIPDPALDDPSRIEWDLDDGVRKTTEVRAMELDPDDIYLDPDLDEWLTVTKRGDHGATVLLSCKGHDGSTYDKTFDDDDVIELITEP